MINYHCQFSVPVDLGSKQYPDYEYSVLDCTSTEPTSTIALIQNQETGAEFYVQKSIDYGDTLILVFLLLFAIFGMVKIITDFWIPRRVTKF